MMRRTRMLALFSLATSMIVLVLSGCGGGGAKSAGTRISAASSSIMKTGALPASTVTIPRRDRYTDQYYGWSVHWDPTVWSAKASGGSYATVGDEVGVSLLNAFAAKGGDAPGSLALELLSVNPNHSVDATQDFHGPDVVGREPSECLDYFSADNNLRGTNSAGTPVGQSSPDRAEGIFAWRDGTAAAWLIDCRVLVPGKALLWIKATYLGQDNATSIAGLTAQLPAIHKVTDTIQIPKPDAWTPKVFGLWVPATGARWLHSWTDQHTDGMDDVIFGESGVPNCMVLQLGHGATQGTAELDPSPGGPGTTPYVALKADATHRLAGQVISLPADVAAKDFTVVVNAPDRDAHWNVALLSQPRGSACP